MRLYVLQNTGLDSNFNRTIDFKNKTEQYEFFNNKSLNFFDTELNEFTFIRDNNAINVNKPYNSLVNVDYIMYKTTLAGITRWVYAFVTDIEYLNKSTTRLHYMTDVLQTYMFDYNLGECYIDREHQDRISQTEFFGNTTLERVYSTTEEALDIGKTYEVIDTKEKIDKIANQQVIPYLIVTANPLTLAGDIASVSSASTWGLDSGLNYYLVFVSQQTQRDVHPAKNGLQGIPIAVTSNVQSDSDFESLPSSQEIQRLAKDNNVLSINALPFSPVDFIEYDYNGVFAGIMLNNNEVYFYGYTNANANSANVLDAKYFIERVNIPFENGGESLHPIIKISNNRVNRKIEPTKLFDFDEIDFQDIDKITTSPFDDKKIVNESKLYTHPYYYYMLQTNPAVSKVIRPEFLKPNPQIKGYYGFGSRIKTTVKVDSNENYPHVTNNQSLEIPLINDAYLTFLQNNKAQAMTGVAVPIATTVGGIALSMTGVGAVAGAGMVAGGVMSAGSVIANDMARRRDLQERPDDIRSHGNDIHHDYNAGFMSYTFDTMSIQEDVKKRLFNYFYRYGYKSQEFKKPNLNSRYWFNYIKTLQTQINGSLPQRVKEQIQNIYEKGVTFYHYKSEIHSNQPTDDIFDTQKENIETSIYND